MTRIYPFFAIVAITALAACTATTAPRSAVAERVDSLNAQAYAWHYKNVDSLRSCADEALQGAIDLKDEKREAEALNHIAFERFQQMDFDSVLVLAQRVEQLTESPSERLVADVMQMKVAQRTSDNSAFFTHRTHALKRIEQLQRRETELNAHDLRRFAYGCSEAHIVSSTYFYYLDQRERAIDEIKEAEPYCRQSVDTAQWLNYCYMRGSGGLSEQTNTQDVTMEEFGFLQKCFILARYEGYRFFEANAAQSLATLFADSTRLDIVKRHIPEQVALLQTIFGTDSTAQHMAEAAFDGFVEYDDLYQEACVLRTLGELAFERGEYEEAIQFYGKALSCVNLHHLCYYAPEQVVTPSLDNDLLQTYDPLAEDESVERRWMNSPDVKTIPEWIAGIRQQLSVAYSAIDAKAESDYNRNIYLDLLDVTREDAELENRAAELRNENQRIRGMVIALIVMAILIALMTAMLVRTYRRRTEAQNRILKQRFEQIQQNAREQREALEDEQEQLREQQAATELRLLRDKQRNIEKRAKLQLVYAIVPFLDRIINEVRRMERQGTTSETSLTYIAELTTRINEYNDLLTEWIQMEQGQLSLQLTSFSLETLFESLRKSHFAYDQKGLTLTVQPTDYTVKADRALTLFMINTLADNARKFTPSGGNVTISATGGENEDGAYVEISVQDTGCGLSAQDIELILTHKVYDAAAIGHAPQDKATTTPEPIVDERKGFGFGLMNCKNIIEKYRKTNPLFRVCRFGIDSEIGAGSRFWFRLPRVMTMLIAVLALSLQPAKAQTHAYELADSVYYCNLHGEPAAAIAYAEQALQEIAENHASRYNTPTQSLVLFEDDGEATEVKWWRNGDIMDYMLILGIRNEVAVAALTLHDWPLYRYNNRAYSQLYKLTNQDTTLEAYCLQTERSQQFKRWAMMLIVVLSLFAVIAIYLFYFRPRLRFRRKMSVLGTQRLQQLQQTNAEEHERQQSDLEMAEDEHRRRLYEEERLHVQNQIIDNCLSAIKHETMYYPGRIQQLVQRGGDLKTLSETVTYYKEVYTLLSAQASQQSEAMNFKRRTISLETLLQPLAQRFQRIAQRHAIDASLTVSVVEQGLQLRGDSDLLMMLMEALFEAELSMTGAHGVGEGQAITMTLKVCTDGQFVRLSLENPAVNLSDDALNDLFMPHQGGIPLLIAKQIIREHDTFLGHPGCRINAERAGEGHRLFFTLPKV